MVYENRACGANGALRKASRAQLKAVRGKDETTIMTDRCEVVRALDGCVARRCQRIIPKRSK